MKEFRGIISRWVIIIKPQPLYPWEKTLATSRSGRLARAGIRTPDRSASGGVIIPNALSRVKTEIHGHVKRNSLVACSPTWKKGHKRRKFHTILPNRSGHTSCAARFLAFSAILFGSICNILIPSLFSVIFWNLSTFPHFSYSVSTLWLSY